MTGWWHPVIFYIFYFMRSIKMLEKSGIIQLDALKVRCHHHLYNGWIWQFQHLENDLKRWMRVALLHWYTIVVDVLVLTWLEISNELVMPHSHAMIYYMRAPLYNAAYASYNASIEYYLNPITWCWHWIYIDPFLIMVALSYTRILK